MENQLDIIRTELLSGQEKKVNADFSRWTRESRFNLSLNGGGIRMLVEMLYWEDVCEKHGKDKEDYASDLDCFHSPTKINYLVRRGLVKRIERPFRGDGWVLTEAGTLTGRLLLISGYNCLYDKFCTERGTDWPMEEDPEVFEKFRNMRHGK